MPLFELRVVLIFPFPTCKSTWFLKEKCKLKCNKTHTIAKIYIILEVWIKPDPYINKIRQKKCEKFENFV